jgi:uncharacterized membrane protein
MHDGMQFYGHRQGFEHHGDHRWLAMLLFVLLVVALVLIAVALLRRARVTAAPAGTPADDALSVLRLRYARGEVGREEFLLAHADLGGSSPPADAGSG